MRYVFALTVIGAALTLTGCDDKAKSDSQKVKTPEGVGEFKSLAPPGAPGAGGGGPAKPAGPSAGSQ